MNAIDLFAGCGGLSRGFMDAGFKVVLGVDNNEPALKTFAFNHKNAKTMNADFLTLNPAFHGYRNYYPYSLLFFFKSRDVM